jgi:hypothetical protein
MTAMTDIQRNEDNFSSISSKNKKFFAATSTFFLRSPNFV